MGGFKAIFWSESIGSSQFRLRIRDNKPNDKKQWFVLDQRTRTIRAAGKRNYVISNQEGSGYAIGKAAVIRAWKGQADQRVSFWSGKYQNIRNNGQKCLAVWGGANRNNQHLSWWNCANAPSHQWFLTRDRPKPLPKAKVTSQTFVKNGVVVFKGKGFGKKPEVIVEKKTKYNPVPMPNFSFNHEWTFIIIEGKKRQVRWTLSWGWVVNK